MARLNTGSSGRVGMCPPEGMHRQNRDSGLRQVLKPMPTGERHRVHIELRNHPEVTTENISEDPRRKVTIIPEEGDIRA